MFQRYTTALLPLGVLVVGVLLVASQAGTSLLGWQTITQLLILLATIGSDFWLKLVPGRWAGAAKTGAGIFGAVVSALVAYVPEGHFTQTTLLLFLTAALKAVATEVGVQIRVDAAKVIDAGSTADAGVPSITSLPDPSKVSDGDPAIIGTEPARL